MWKAVFVVLIGLLSLAVTAQGCKSTPAVQTGPEVGKLAPEFTLNTLNGEAVSLTSLKGKNILLNIWAIWCPPCREELPWFQEVFQQQSDRVAVYTINIGEDRVTIKDFMEKSNYTFPVLMDYPDKLVSKAYRVAYIPDTYSIDKDGVIKAIKVGSFETKQELMSLIP